MAWSGLGTVRHVEVCDIDESELAFVDMWTDNSTVVEIAGRSISTLLRKLCIIVVQAEMKRNC